MSLTDIMSAMRLHSFAEAALVLFFITFLAIAIHLFRTRKSDAWERARHLPLDNHDSAASTQRSATLEPLPRGPSNP